MKRPTERRELSDAGIAPGPWQAFVEQADGHYTQTSMWAEAKAVVGWTSERVAVRRGGELTGGTQVLLRRAPVLGPIALVPSTPVFVRDEHTLDEVVDQLLRLCVRRRIGWLKVQPTPGEQGDVRLLEQILRQHRFVRSDVQGRDAATTRVALGPDPERVLASMRSGLRANIRKAGRKGAVVVREGDENDLATFATLMGVTAARQEGMPLFERAYYEQVWRSFSSHGRGRLMLAEHERQPLSAILLVTHGDTCEYLYGGWNRTRSDLHANEFLQWSAIMWACQQGFHWYNLGKIDPAIGRRVLAGERVPTDAATGQTRYKLGFNGQVQLSPPAYDTTGRPALRPILRVVAPRLRFAAPVLSRARGLSR